MDAEVQKLNRVTVPTLGPLKMLSGDTQYFNHRILALFKMLMVRWVIQDDMDPYPVKPGH
jgi:hypothetical protein